MPRLGLGMTGPTAINKTDAVLVDNAKTIIKLTKGRPTFYQYHALANLNNTSDIDSSLKNM